MRCPACRADVHTCRQCRFYDTRYIGGCSHDHADKVLDKQNANYCTHFRPSPQAYLGQTQNSEDEAREALAALFGEHSLETDAKAAEQKTPPSAADDAQRQAEALFSSGRKTDREE